MGIAARRICERHRRVEGDSLIQISNRTFGEVPVGTGDTARFKVRRGHRRHRIQPHELSFGQVSFAQLSVDDGAAGDRKCALRVQLNGAFKVTAR
jgi:hypothetical protein